jgi:deazaflavin-dependent oxidoreductase (nitroreductase family)
MRLSQVLQRAVRYFNPIARFLLNTPLHPVMSGRLMLISFNGRVTGRPYVTPVSYVQEKDSLLVPGGGKWWKNIETTPQPRVRLRGAWKVVTPDVVREQHELTELMRRMLAANPAIALFTGIKAGPDGPDAAALERERRRGFVVVKLRLDEARSASSAGKTSQPGLSTRHT